MSDAKQNLVLTKEIVLIKVVWGGPAKGTVAWKMESWMRESYPELFLSGSF